MHICTTCGAEDNHHHAACYEPGCVDEDGRPAQHFPPLCCPGCGCMSYEIAHRPPMAGKRDASWWNQPNVRHPARWHVILGERAACGRLMVVFEDDLRPLDDRSVILRCRRNGCRQRWPESVATSDAG